MGSVNSKVSEDEAYLDLAGSCSGLSLACARLHLSSGQVQEDDHSRSWRVSRLLHPGCRLLRQERQVCRQVQESKESQVRVELLLLCDHNSPDVTVAGRTLNVLFRSNKRSKGGEGAECEATCVDPDDETPTTVAPPATTPTPPVTTAAPPVGRENLIRRVLSDPLAVCNDGSNAAIYDSNDLGDSTKLHIYLKGGGGCHSFEDSSEKNCVRRCGENIDGALCTAST